MAGQNNSDYQAYYVPEKSKLAIFASVSVGLMLIGVGNGINGSSGHFAGYSSPFGWPVFFTGFALFALTLFAWFGITIKENLQGLNSDQLKRSYRMGMQWFIFSEVMFFASFFGALFYVRSLAGPWLAGEGDKGAANSLLWGAFQYAWPLMETPQDAIGGVANQVMANNGVFTGPDKHMSFPGFANMLHWLPFWNTLLLVTSSVFCELAHHAMKKNHRTQFNFWLFMTLLFGFIFVYLQYVEYHEAYLEYGLKLTSGIYGTTFFMLTGFHGFHVCMGAFILTVQWLRSMKAKHFTPTDHFGFEAAAWYWHFVDVVWIFLVLVVYLF